MHFQIRVTDTGNLEVLLDNSSITDQVSSVGNSSTNTLVDIRRTELNRIESTFSNGISVGVTLLSEILNFVVVLPQSFMGMTQGLMGNFNGNDTDDFVYPNGTVLDNSAGDRAIHYFGQTCKLANLAQHNRIIIFIT